MQARPNLSVWRRTGILVQCKASSSSSTTLSCSHVTTSGAHSACGSREERCRAQSPAVTSDQTAARDTTVFFHVSSFLTLDPNESGQTAQVAPNTIRTNLKQRTESQIACSQWSNPRRTSTSLNCTVLGKRRNKITTFSSSEEQLTQDRALQKK